MMEKLIEFLKKAEFNSIMLALAIGATAFYFKIDTHPYNEIAFFTAIVTSSYCVIRLIAFCFNKIREKCMSRKEEKKKNLARRKKEEQEQMLLKIEISRMFDGLTKDDKEALALIIKSGKEDKYTPTVLHYNKGDYQLTDLIGHIEAICRIFRKNDRHVYDPYDGQPCITITHYSNTIALTIEPYLLDLIKMYNQE